jgi:putative PIN family toxin of toxin-antitoxin system
MIKAVYDSNVIVAALINPNGLPALLLDLATQNRIQLFLSNFLLREYEAVLRRPKFGFSPAKVRNVVRAIHAHATVVKPRETLQVLTDPSDNHILTCAVESRVDYLVTGNKRHFPFSVFRGVGIVSPRPFWEIYQASLREIED